MGLKHTVRRWYEALYHYMELPGESALDRARRRQMLPVETLIMLFCIYHTVAVSPPPGFLFFGLVMCAFICGAGACVAVFRVRIDYSKLVTMMCLGLALGILAIDINNASQTLPRAWPYLILCMDFLLIFEAAPWTHAVIITLSVTVLSAEAAESALLYGFYDVGNWNQGFGTSLVCNCPTPPCAVLTTDAIASCARSIIIFVTDFFLTRNFAVKLRRQMAIVDTTVTVAERVAVLLAAYNVTEAEKAVAADGAALPPALHAAYELLLQNLKSYRPYLPDSVLAQESADDEDVEPPGIDGGDGGAAEVCLCFTDIESSTALWDAFPQGMYDALDIHNRVMRKAAKACDGYEVKTIGDAFMLAFATPIGACRFGLEAQRMLLAQQWPADLLMHDLCRTRATPAGDGLLWNGLRVRIGINCGEARVKRNPVTGRCDYFGGTVNVAARVEAAVQRGGLVGVTQNVLATLGEKGLAELEEPAVTHLGTRELKGVREAVPISIMLPRELVHRATVVTDPIPARPQRQAQSAPQATWCSVGAVDQEHRQSNGSRASVASDTDAEPVTTTSVQFTPGHRKVSPGVLPLHPVPTLHAIAAVQPLAATQKALQQTLISTVCVRIQLRATLGADPVGMHLTAIEAAADLSHGVVAAVLSCCANVAFNTSRPCPEHGIAAGRFIGVVQRDRRAPLCHFGAASGRALWGNLAAGRRAYATVIGSCIELSAALAEEAELSADPALGVGAPVETFSAQGKAFRAQLWNTMHEETTFVVWELLLGAKDGSCTSEGEDDAESDWMSGLFQSRRNSPKSGAAGTLAGVFREITGMEIAEQVEALSKLAEDAPSDERVRRLLQRAERGVVRRRQVAVPNAFDMFEQRRPQSRSFAA